MKIDSSTMSLSSYSSQTAATQTTEQLDVWFDSAAPGALQQPGFDAGAINEISVRDVDTYEISDVDAMKIQLLNKMFEALTGKKLRFYLPEKYRVPASKDSGEIYRTFKPSSGTSQPLGWGIRYQKQEYIQETAQMSFSASGIIKTSDGRSIDISLDLSLSRSFSSTKVTSFAAGDAAVDPLVVNFGGASAELTAQKYSFDLTGDGRNENISFVSNGSGFLVLDKNRDGMINSGKEMFGPSMGSGFLELKSYDDDGNNWIDENDSIYHRLQIWTKDEAGSDQLFAIGQVGIGAIYLGGISSHYELKDSSNMLQGAIRETSIFLREDATAGTIQHVDLSL